MKGVACVLAVYALAVAAQNVERVGATEPPRRSEAQQRMDGEGLARSQEVARRAERVAAHERPLLREPERDLVPARPVGHLDRLDPGEPAERDAVMRHAEARGDGRTVASVPVQHLHDRGRLAQRADALVEALDVERVGDPDAAGRADGVAGALEVVGLGRLPAEAGLELVDNAHRGTLALPRMEERHRQALERASQRLARLDFYPRPVRTERVRIFITPWFFRIPGLRRFDGYTLIRTILLRSRDASDNLITHELTHIWKMQHRPLAMIWAFFRYRYANNPYEIEARRAVDLTRT